MGYLLKEALKTLCGVNQWSYAVFWKFGCQNPKLLIWEECYYEHALSCSEISGLSTCENSSWVLVENGSLRCNDQARDKVHLLVNNMMMDNHVVISGERLVGRVAFTGSHQWILSQNYYREAHPPEVLKELCRQFSAGMQTIAVIPVLPHGVVQFGSLLPIMENLGFVNDVTSLVLELGLIAGVFPPEDYAVKEQSAKLRSLACLENSTSCLLESSKYVGYSDKTFTVDSQTSLVREMQTTDVAAFQGSGSTPEAKIAPALVNSGLMNAMAKAEVIPSNSKILMSRNTPLYHPSLSMVYCTNDGLARCASVEDQTPYRGVLSNTKSVSSVNSVPDLKRAGNGHISSKQSPCIKLDNVNFAKWEASKSESVDLFTADTLLAESNNAFVQHESGDDLFDVLGPDYKNKLFSSSSNGPLGNKSAPKGNTCKSRAWSEIYSTSQGNSDCGIFSSETDNLLEAVVSQVNHPAKRSMDESVSCKTTLTSTSSSSAPNASLPCEASAIIKGELFGVPNYLAKAGTTSLGTYSQSSSIYGPKISSWVDKEIQSNSVSTGYSKKPHETSKLSRKRLKPGENPRPRPKDRQMIQDRVKELREIVPNGAKCSIDSLLERTIKHMLFLQSVMKHADKLKQTGESEGMSKDGGVTWAYEVGAESMVCPIRVEDLNQPRQMLVEMLCEERGLFLEIADVIRGLGLTILKGIMETRDKKIWSRFTVEANRDITRMEVFMSLVHLLEESASAGGQPHENLLTQQVHMPRISPNISNLG